jgi:hypothetical protein
MAAFLKIDFGRIKIVGIREAPSTRELRGRYLAASESEVVIEI